MTSREREYIFEKKLTKLLARKDYADERKKMVGDIFMFNCYEIPETKTNSERWPVHGIELTNAEGKTATILFDDKERT